MDERIEDEPNGNIRALLMRDKAFLDDIRVQMSTSREFLIAHGRTVEEIRDIIGVDSLGYLSIEATNKIAVGAKCGFCNGCFSGVYPIETPDTIEKNIFESGIGEHG